MTIDALAARTAFARVALNQIDNEGSAHNIRKEAHMTTTALDHRPRRMSILHALVVGAAVAGFLFVAFWATEAAGIMPLSPELHDLVFQRGERGPSDPIYDLAFTIGFGAILGASIAIFANLLGFLDRR